MFLQTERPSKRDPINVLAWSILQLTDKSADFASEIDLPYGTSLSDVRNVAYRFSLYFKDALAHRTATSDEGLNYYGFFGSDPDHLVAFHSAVSKLFLAVAANSSVLDLGSIGHREAIFIGLHSDVRNTIPVVFATVADMLEQFVLPGYLVKFAADRKITGDAASRGLINKAAVVKGYYAPIEDKDIELFVSAAIGSVYLTTTIDLARKTTLDDCGAMDFLAKIVKREQE